MKANAKGGEACSLVCVCYGRKSVNEASAVINGNARNGMFA